MNFQCEFKDSDFLMGLRASVSPFHPIRIVQRCSLISGLPTSGDFIRQNPQHLEFVSGSNYNNFN